MRKDNPPIPVGIETGGLESLQRFETHWKVQKKEILFGCSASVQEKGLQQISSRKSQG